MQSLSSVIFEDINDEYGYGMYLGLKIMICKRNGFVNATKLCAKFEKQLKNWLQNQSSKELIEEVSAAGIPATEIISTGDKTRTKIRGTYVHKLLIPHIASWISPSVGIKVSQIVNEFVISEQLREKDRMLHEKDDKIQILINKIDDQSKQINDQSKQINDQSKQINTLLEKTDYVIQQNEELKDDVDIVSTKLDVATDQRVVPLKDKRDEVFMVFRTGEDQYYACRIQKLRKNYCINKYGDPIVEIENSNTVNLLLHIKEDKFLEGKIKCYRNTIRVLANHLDLAAEIRRVDNEKKNV